MTTIKCCVTLLVCSVLGAACGRNQSSAAPRGDGLAEPMRSSEPPALARTAEPEPRPSYVVETQSPPEPIDVGLLEWPPKGAKLPPGAAACRGWRNPLGHACSRSNGLGEHLAALAERAQLPEDLLGNPPTSERRHELEKLSSTLLELEGCPALEAGIVRLLRALWLPECAGELAQSALSEPRAAPPRGEASQRPMSASTRLSLYGIALGESIPRSVEGIPRYPGDFDSGRFGAFVNRKVLPWQKRTTELLDQWEAQVTALPRGTHGRALAMLGLARGVFEFAIGHRRGPVAAEIKRDYMQRTRYYGALDDLSQVAWERLRPLVPRVSEELAIQGNYGHAPTDVAWDALLQRAWDPFPRLVLPALPATGLSVEALIAARIPLPISLELLSVEDLLSPNVIAAMARQGLPMSVRVSIERALLEQPEGSEARQAVHSLLAQSLLRLGLVTRQRPLFERAKLELAYAAPSPRHRFLMALAELLAGVDATWLLTPRAERENAVSPAWERSILAPKALALPAGSVLQAAARVDGALLGYAFSPSTAMRDASVLARYRDDPVLGAPYRKCIVDLLWGWGCCGGFIKKGAPQPEPCVFWPWRLDP